MDSTRLSDEQSKLLVKIHTSPSPRAAYTETQAGRQPVAASVVLVKMGMITQTESGVEITQLGTDALRDNGMLDEAGELTTHAQQLLGDSSTSGGDTMPPPEGKEPDALDSSDESSQFESLSLHRDINSRLVE